MKRKVKTQERDKRGEKMRRGKSKRGVKRTGEVGRGVHGGGRQE